MDPNHDPDATVEGQPDPDRTFTAPGFHAKTEAAPPTAHGAPTVERPAPQQDWPTSAIHLGPNPPPGTDQPRSGPADDDATWRDRSEWNRDPAPRLEVNEVVFGHFRLLDRLGKGGMGEVWRARNLEMRWERALKLIAHDAAANDVAWNRFKREAQLMDKLQHPGVVRVYDCRRAQSMGYIEMEIVRGRSLDKILAESPGRPMPLAWIVPIVDQLCAVLHLAHNHVDGETNRPRPIVHRDLKPSNLMLLDGKPAHENLKVLDFGIAKIQAENETLDDQLTGQGVFLGTVSYSSPEQIRNAGRSDDSTEGQVVGPRSDLYSMGVMLYEFLTGSCPFRGPIVAVISAHLNDKPPEMARANPESRVPAAVERLVMQCLSKDPRDRPANALEFAAQFRAAAGFGSAVTPAAATATHVAPDTPSRLSKRALAVATLVLILAVVGGVLALRWTSEIVPPPPPPPPPPKSDLPWVPPGYRAVDPTRFAAGQRREPLQLIRLRDGVEFNRIAEGVYLPVGFMPENGDLVGDWPAAIIPTADKDKAPELRTRYRRIAGTTFQMGDPDPAGPSLDGQGNPCLPAWVRVEPFYLGETEVTNGAVAALSKTAGPGVDLKTWRQARDVVAETHPSDVDRYPAVGLSYPTARRLAAMMGGRLPADAEWELAITAGVGGTAWAWGNDVPPRGEPWANLFQMGRGPNLIDPVATYDHDKTSQGIFDLTGNVREWCLDAYAPRIPPPAGNGPGQPLDVHPDELLISPDRVKPDAPYVIRGGSYLIPLDAARSFQRTSYPAGEEVVEVGFRVVIECPPSPPDR